ncbi:MAG: hypothetical protein ACLRT4_07445 [Thomasclavelia sp.]
MELARRNGYKFIVEKEFKGEYLCPIIDNLKAKYIDGFDDYNEVYHCNQLIHQLNQDSKIKLDYHLMYQEDKCLGLALIATGTIDALEFFDQPLFKTTDKAIVLNYFHISSQGRGNGTYWLKNIILPYYQDKDYMYLKSSHPHAFSLYQRLGEVIGEYETVSDNGDFKRKGKLFKIKVSK